MDARFAIAARHSRLVRKVKRRAEKTPRKPRPEQLEAWILSSAG